MFFFFPCPCRTKIQFRRGIVKAVAPRRGFAGKGIVFRVSRTAYLVIDSSEANSDLYHSPRTTVGFFVPDPVIFFERDGKTTLVLSDLELERGESLKGAGRRRRDSSFSRCVAGLRGKGNRSPSTAEVAAAVLRERGIRSLVVQRTFPVFFADALREAGFSVKTAKTHFLFEDRLVKSPREVSFIKKALFRHGAGDETRGLARLVLDSEGRTSFSREKTSHLRDGEVGNRLLSRRPGLPRLEHHSGGRGSGLDAPREGLGTASGRVARRDGHIFPAPRKTATSAT